MIVRLSLKKMVVTVLLLGLLFLALAAAGVATWEYTNSDAFCSNACHSVHPEETYAHRTSPHSGVQCVECHVGRRSAFRNMVVKAAHIKHAWALLVGYERPLSSPSMPASRDSCEGCHSREPHRHNSVRLRWHYAPDEQNTEPKVGIILRTAGRRLFPGEGQGIHWRMKNQVRFFATDPQKQNIPWIEVTREDGSKVIFTDTTQALNMAEIADADKPVMECVDCHNRSGHPFRNPEELMDEALASGRLNRDLPFVKQRGVELLNEDFGSEEEALQLVEAAWDKYQKDFPNLAKENPGAWEESEKYMRERQQFVADLMTRSRFLEPGVSWRSFSDESGHKYTPGCFRCHSGKHKDGDNNPVPINCTICHSVPMVIRNDEFPSYMVPLVNRPKPEDHLRQDFMLTHRKVDETCWHCHGEIKFGVDDKTFCANSGCHGEVWPNLVVAPGRRSEAVE